jgi:sulfonate transport system substrate-binding protein
VSFRSTRSTRSTRRTTRALAAAGAFAIALVTVGGVSASTAGASSKSAKVNLSGVTITFGDQFKEYQTILTATNALAGAPYTVKWTDFVGGPPIIAAETGGSVDLGDMAETPTIFAQAAGDPVKVVAVTQSANPKISPYAIVVPTNSPIKKLSQLKGQTVGVQEGTVEQYVLIQLLKKAGLSYSSVNVENLSVIDASAAVSSGKVAAAVISQPLTAIDLAGGKVRVLASGAGAAQTLGYLTASDSALSNPNTAAALADFLGRFYKAAAILKKDPGIAEAAYVKIYGVNLAEAKEAAATVQANAVPITSSIINYQQTEANTFLKLGLITKKISVKSVFDLPYNKAVNAKAGIK